MFNYPFGDMDLVTSDFSEATTPASDDGVFSQYSSDEESFREKCAENELTTDGDTVDVSSDFIPPAPSSSAALKSKCSFKDRCNVNVITTYDGTKGGSNDVVSPLPTTVDIEPKRLSREDIGFCPKCVKKDKKSLLTANQLDNEYVVTCNVESCLFIGTGVGIVPLGKELLVGCGYPEELLLHMDVYEDDLNKITRLCTYEYLKKKTPAFSENIEQGLLEINDEIEVLQLIHGIHPKDRSTNFNNIQILPSFGELLECLKHLVADITNDYKEKVINAFSKIESFNFPEDLIVSIKNSRLAFKSLNGDEALEGYLESYGCSSDGEDSKIETSQDIQELIGYKKDYFHGNKDKDELDIKIENLKKELEIEELLNDCVLSPTNNGLSPN